MGKSILYAANVSTQTVNSTGSIINFGSVVRRYGCNLNLSGGNAEVKGCGYYKIDTNISFIPTAAGLATIQIYKDGVAIPGAEASVTTVASETYTVSIPPVVIKQNCDCTDTITVTITGVEGSVTNAFIMVEKS